MSKALQATITSNLFWLIASLVLAILVWFIAKIEANPIDQRAFTRPITILVDDNMIITDQSSDNARVFVSAQETTLTILQPDDITVAVDLTGRPAGRYTVPLDVDISRLASSDTQPTQITVEIEPLFSQQIPVEIVINGLPRNYAADMPERDIFQAVVSGATDDVSQVSVVVATIDLSNQQSTGMVERTIVLQAQDADGNRVVGVTIEPTSLLVALNITQREDIRTFTVLPDIDFTSLPEAFEFRDVEYEPNTVIINGSPDVLQSLGDTIYTVPISLQDRTGDFTTEVQLDLPNDSNLIILSEPSTVQVDIFISEEEATLALENVPVRMIGEDENSNLTATLNPTSLSIVLTGPASDIEGISADDIQAIVDINGLNAGTYNIVPIVEINQGQITLEASNIRLIPSDVSVSIVAPQPEITQSPDVTPTAIPTADD